VWNPFQNPWLDIMKTQNKILYTALFTFAMLVANAQQETDRSKIQINTSVAVSKGVQKISGRNLATARLSVVSVGTPAWALPKGVQKTVNRNIKSDTPSGNLVSKGYPEWIISKDVQRIGR